MKWTVLLRIDEWYIGCTHWGAIGITHFCNAPSHYSYYEPGHVSYESNKCYFCDKVFPDKVILTASLLV